METGKRIKELRIKKGMTQEELADKTEISTRTIQRIENGVVAPRAYTLQTIAKALDVEFGLFFENETEKKQDHQKVDGKSWLALLHFSGIVPLFFPTLIVWRTIKNKTDDTSNHFRAAITMQLCIWLISLIGCWIYWKVNQPVPLIGGLLVGSLIAIMNTIFVIVGKPYINPFSKQFSKG